MIVGEVMAEFGVWFFSLTVYIDRLSLIRWRRLAVVQTARETGSDALGALRGAMRPWFHYWFRRYLYCLLVCIVCFPTYPFSFTFPYLSLTLPLYFSLRIDSLRFQAGCRKWWLKLAFCLHFWMRSLVALGLVCFSIRSRQTAWLAETSAKWRAVWCVETDVKPQLTHSLNQSINQSITERSK